MIRFSFFNYEIIFIKKEDIKDNQRKQRDGWDVFGDELDNAKCGISRKDFEIRNSIYLGIGLGIILGIIITILMRIIIMKSI